MSGLRSHLTYANVMVTLLAFVVLGGGAAYAANTVFSADIVDGEVKTADLASNAVTSVKLHNNQVKGVDLAADAVDSSKVLDNSLNGADVFNGSLTGSDVLSSSLTGSDVADSSLTGSDVATGSLTGSDVADASLTGSDVGSSSLTGSDVADESITTADVAGASRSGAISVNAISNGRCTTITGNVTGAQPGDAAILTTNGSIPGGMFIYAQRSLTNAVDIKVCNLSGATSAAITDLPVRVVTIH
jgi:uncharacterized protein YjbI with pentapeptide repeats